MPLLRRLLVFTASIDCAAAIARDFATMTDPAIGPSATDLSRRAPISAIDSDSAIWCSPAQTKFGSGGKHMDLLQVCGVERCSISIPVERRK